MRAIYRTTFELRVGAGKGDLFDEFSEIVWSWIFDRKEIGLEKRPPGAKGPVTFAAFSPSSITHIEAIRTEFGGQTGWSVVYSQSDRHSRELMWISDLALLRKPDGRSYFSFTQSLGRQDGGMSPMTRQPGRPRVIRTLVRDFTAASGGFRLSTMAIPLRDKPEDVEQVVNLLESSTRTHPVVLVSVHQQSGRYFVDPDELADHLSGIAHVVAAVNPHVTAELSKRMPRWSTCIDGAVRVYWPGFKRIKRTVDHRLWTIEDLSRIQFDSGRFADLVLADIAAVSVNSISPNYGSFDRLQSLDRSRIIALAKDNRDWKDMAELYAEDNSAKEARIIALERELREKTEALFEEKQLTAALTAALDSRKLGVAGEIEEQLPIRSVAEAIGRAQSRYPNQLSFALNARSEDDSPYGYPEEVWAAFEWLATTYYRARMKIESCPDFSASVAVAVSGWSYSAHQKESTMKANEEWYRCTYDGRRLWIAEHLKSGSGRDAAESIRIAFSWDEKTKRTVVGYIGLHQKNTKT